MNAEKMNWGSVTVPLKYQVETEAGPIKEITMREPDGEALEAIEEVGMVEGEKPKMRQILATVSILSGLPKSVINRLHRDDITEVVSSMAPLLIPAGEASQPSQEAGGNTATA